MDLSCRTMLKVPGGEDLIHGGTAAPTLHAEPLSWLWCSRLSMEDLKENTWFKPPPCISVSCKWGPSRFRRRKCLLIEDLTFTNVPDKRCSTTVEWKSYKKVKSVVSAAKQNIRLQAHIGLWYYILIITIGERSDEVSLWSHPNFAKPGFQVGSSDSVCELKPM